MKKFLKKLILTIFIILAAIVGYFTYEGYTLYKNAIEECSIQEKVEEIKSSVDVFTEYEQLPQDYINAVIAVEDRRYFTHNGIDLISITRAIYTDIKEMHLV